MDSRRDLAAPPTSQPSAVSRTSATKFSVGLALILVAFIALSVGYGFSFPLFEGFDEASHYRLVDYYARNWTLPDLERAPSHEAHQPPLYYVAGALLIAPINRDDFDRVFQLNPGEAINVRQNIVPTDTSTPLHGTALAVRVLRLFSTLIGAASVLLTYMLVKQMRLPAETALLAAALLAFNPKFIMLSSWVSNDVATACLATLCLVLSVRIMTRAPSMKRAFVLGVAVGLATLSKYSGLALGLPAIFAVTWSVVNNSREPQVAGYRRWRELLGGGAALLAGTLLVCGWLFALQWVRYGNPLAWGQVSALNLFARRATPLSVIDLTGEVPALLPTMWRVNPGLAAQHIGDALAWAALGLAAVGWVQGALRKALPATAWVLPLAIAASVIALFPWISTYRGAEDGRLLPAAFSSLAVLIAVGVMSLHLGAGVHTATRINRWLSAGLIVSAAIWAACVPSALILPLYPPLAPLPAHRYIMQVSASEASELPLNPVAHYTNGIELTSATLKNDRLSPGEPARLTLVWRVVGPPLRSYALTLQAFSMQGQLLGKWDGLPLNGRRSTLLWQVGDVYRDEYSVPITVGLSTQPTVVNLFAGWHAATPPYSVAGVVSSQAVSALVGRLKVRAAQPITAPPQHGVDAQFGGVIGLEGYDLDGDRITLHWRALGDMPVDYQVFVHALDAHGRLIAQIDGPMPCPTSLWDKHELILDIRTVRGLSQAAKVQVGIYDLASGARLPARRVDGSAWPDNSVTLWQTTSP